ncbi:MAG: chorismate-binding protein, partial [Arcobacter sp.]
MSKELIKEKLNKFGFEKEPFLFVISYDFSKFYIEKLSNLSDSIKYQLDNKEESKQNIQNKISLEKFPIPFKEYKKKFDILQKEIKKGNSYLLNLTAKTKIKTTLSLDEIYENTKSRFKLRFKNQKDDFVCFSPERFIKIEDNNIFTYPMKGTIDAKFPNAKEKILTNQKEMAEHTMVVDLLRNDL